MKTKTVFRVWLKTGEVIALFPRMAHDRAGVYCSSYMHVGQHGAADTGIVRNTRLATRKEYAPLARELRRIGYRLDIRTRCTRGDSLARQYGVR